MNYLTKIKGWGKISDTSSRNSKNKKLINKILHLFLMLVLLAPMGVNGQETLTVYGNTTNWEMGVPVDFINCGNHLKAEYIIPASELTIMNGSTLTNLKYYCYNDMSWGGNDSFQVFLKEVDNTSLTDFSGTTGATIVYQGNLSVNSEKEMVVNFTTSYTYQGGNLLIGFYKNGTTASDIYNWWDCVSMAGASVYGNSSSSLESITATQFDYVPKTTFTYISGNTPSFATPQNLSASDITLHGATLSWTAPNEDVTRYDFQYKASDATEWTASNTTATTMSLDGLTSTTTFTFQVKAVYADGASDFVETTFSTLNACQRPTNLNASAAGDGTTATLTWTENGEATSWVLHYGTDAGYGTYTEVTEGFSVNGNTVTYVLTGLTMGQKYYYRVKPACDTEGTLWSYANFTPIYANVTINGTSTQGSEIPICGAYVGYGVASQFIIPAESLEQLIGSTVKQLIFYAYHSSSSWGSPEFEVYVAEVENTTFSSATLVDWNTMTQVYNGVLGINSNKMAVTLNGDGFMYQGGNLMIGFKQTAVGTSQSRDWYVKSVYGYTGVTSYTNSSGTVNTYRVSGLPYMTLFYVPTAYPRVNPIETGTIASTTAQFSWTAPNSDVTGYAYQYKRLTDAAWPAEWTNLNATTITLTGLNPATDYRFRVKALYGNNESVPNTISFTTECAEFANVPLSENFDNYVDGDMPRCWSRIANNGYPKVYEYSSYAHSGNNTLQFWKYNGTSYPDVYAILPQMQNLSGLRVKFYARRNSSTASSITVGVMTDPTDASTFQAIETYDCEMEYQKYKLNLSSYTGNGYIAIKTGSTPCYVFVDDITVEAIPNCEEPEGLTAGNVDAHAATFSWTDSGNPSVWQIYVSTDNVMPAEPITGNLHNVSSNPATVSGLAPVTTYYAWVRSSCGSSDYSPWSDPVSFTTDIACPQQIYWYDEEQLIAATYAYLPWYSDGQETAWQICLNDDEDHLIDADNNLFTITGLTPATEYSMKVRANCGGEDGYSEWSSERWFWTDLCDPEDKCNISFVTNSEYWDGAPVVMSGEETVAWLPLYEGSGEIALCPGDYNIVWQGSGDGYFAIYGSDGNKIYSTDHAEDLEYGEVLVLYTHVCEGVCFPPQHLDAWAHSEEATVTWEAGGSETQWMVQYDALYAANTTTFEGLTDLPDGWDSWYGNGGNVALGTETIGGETNQYLQMTRDGEDSYAQVYFPVILGGTYSFQAKAIGNEEVTVYYEWWDNEGNYDEDEQIVGTDAYQTISIGSEGYSGNGTLSIAISNAASIAIDNVSIPVVNENYSNEAIAVTNTSYAIQNLSPGAAYKVRVKAICGPDDESGWKETTFSTSLCDDACPIRYVLGDEDGDGWNGAYISVWDYDSHKEVRLTLENGSSSSGFLPLCPGAYGFFWESGYNDSECSFTLYGSDWTTVLFSHEEGTNFPDDYELLASYQHECEGNNVFEVSYDNPYIETFEYGFWDTWNTNEGYNGYYSCDPYSWEASDGVAYVSPGCYTTSYFCIRPVKVTPTTQLTFRAWLAVWLDNKQGDASLLVSTNNGHSWNTLLADMELDWFDAEGGDFDDFQRFLRKQTISLGDYSQYESILIGFKYQGYSNNNGGGISTMCVDNIRIYDPNVFTDGAKSSLWSNARNWTQGVPGEGDWVLINGDCDLDTDAVLSSLKVNEGKTLTIQNGKTMTTEQTSTSNVSQLVIKDGGQFISNTSALATVEKSIIGRANGGAWNFIASPIEDYEGVNPTSVDAMTDGNFDLYRFNQSPVLVNGVGNEWENYKAHTGDFKLFKGKGYLYSNTNDVILPFIGEIIAGESSSEWLEYAEENAAYDMSFRGWNLVGNPFTFNAYVDRSYYRMKADGRGIEAVANYEDPENTVAPCTGIIVKTEYDSEQVTFSRSLLEPVGYDEKGSLNITLGKADLRDASTTVDNAIISFNEDSKLPKFYFGNSAANIYIPQDNEEYAVVYSEGMGEMPLNFKANENGRYTLSFNNDKVKFRYLHLIDNKNGEDVNLLSSHSYTFDGCTTDYESRFKLVFICGDADGDNEAFAFFSNGNWIINNAGKAILQVIDLTGRILSSESVNGSVSTTINATSGVYMLRLINGDNVKVQKVVVK